MNGIYLKRIIPSDPYAPIDGNEFEWDGFTYKVIVKDGLAWLDRNLGASRAATASNDSDAYGDLYQWGRLTDGHEKRTSGTTSTLATTDVPNHGDFIIGASYPFDWRNPQNNNLWQGVDGINNPCPTGWRLPTQAELQAERETWATDNLAGAYESVLKWCLTGRRRHNDGVIDTPTYAYIYTSSVLDEYSTALYFAANDRGFTTGMRARGYAVRPVRDLT
jgi:uncharacterized protein (TIGR02145 family)